MKRKNVKGWVIGVLLMGAMIISQISGMVHPMDVKAAEAAAASYAVGVTNGDFESSSVSSYTITAANGVTYGLKTDAWASNNTTQIFNIYNSNNKAASFLMSTTVSGLAAGQYKAVLDVDGMQGSSGLSLSIGGQGSTIITSGWDVWTTVETASYTLSSPGAITITVSGQLPAGYWGDFDNLELYKLDGISSGDDNSAAVEAGIAIDKVTGMNDDFMKGVDISSYTALKDSGVLFRDFNGNTVNDAGFFALLADSGVNYVRIRVWNNPYDSQGRGYGGGNNDVAKAVELGTLATNAGMRVLVDFHYSDFWADPGKYAVPKAWSSYTIAQKQTAVTTFTTNTLTQLLNAGVDVGMVQVGNETNAGLAGETSWTNIARLMKAGSAAVRSVSNSYSRDIKVALHFTNPESSGKYATFASTLNSQGVDYDVFASSYYPFWHGTLSNLTSVLKNIADTYGKEVMVAETSYIYTTADGDGHENSVSSGVSGYEVSAAGQAKVVRDVMQAVANVGSAGIGVFYWEPAWIPVGVYSSSASNAAQVLSSNQQKWEIYGSGWASSYAGGYDSDAATWYGGSSWDNQAMFDFNGYPLESLKVFSYVDTGTVVNAP